MKLKRVTVENFRCYKDPITVEFDDMTTIVGRNDAGKSTLLDAIDTFFNERQLDKNDASKGGNPRAVKITCVFTDIPSELILDESALTSLEQEGLLNQDGDLEISKVFNCSIEKPKLTRVSIRALHPTANAVDDLLSLKIDELKARAEALGVDMSAVNRTIKAELRNAIRSRVGTLGLAIVDVPLLGEGVDEKGNCPKVLDGIKAALPLFALFKSDRQSSDQDPEAQDPLKAAIKEAIAAKATELQALMDHIEGEVKKVADLTLAKLKEMDPSVAATLDPRFERPAWHNVIKASITGDQDIPLNKRGSGVRRLVLLNFFRAKAEKAMLEKKAQSTIYAVEEPETGQHPHNQRLLMNALQQLSVGADQVIVTTHTPMLARMVDSNSLRFISKDAAGIRTVRVGGSDAVNADVAHSLGVLPDHQIKAFIIVEGVHDITFLKGLSRMFRAHGLATPDLEALELSGELVFVPAGGAENLAYWSAKLAGLERPELHLFDRDAPSTAAPKHQAKMDAVNARPRCTALSTSRREMENFVHHEAINLCANANGLPLALASALGPDADVPAHLTAELNLLAPQHAKWGHNKVKGWLAQVVVPSMTPAMLAEVDPHNEMLGWLNHISTMVLPTPVPEAG